MWNEDEDPIHLTHPLSSSELLKTPNTNQTFSGRKSFQTFGGGKIKNDHHPKIHGETSNLSSRSHRHQKPSSLGIDLSFQNFTAELDSLPGFYTPPFGALFIALTPDEEVIGCVGLRPLSKKPRSITSRHEGNDDEGGKGENAICEIKRLYCTPSSRGLGVGRALVEEVIREAERLGYEEMRLDTLPSMEGARKLYGRYGFEEIGAYYETPLEGTFFLRKKLGRRERMEE
jgi:ribosomal protein S18 acetylase RimI-like enzyme